MDDDPRELLWEMGKSVLLIVTLFGLRYLGARAIKKEKDKAFERTQEEEFIDVESW